MSTNTEQIKGHVVLVMAPMGSGKGTLIKNELAKHPSMYHTVSCTSRAPRPGEKDGVHYYFLTREEFDAKIAAGDFLEWAEFAGNKYGTLKDEILPRLSESEIVILEIELQGVQQLMKILPVEHMTVIYIEAGGWEVLKQRALERAPMSEEELDARYKRFLIEQEAKPIANVVVDNSQSLDVAKEQFSAAIDAAYQKCT